MSSIFLRFEVSSQAHLNFVVKYFSKKINIQNKRERGTERGNRQSEGESVRGDLLPIDSSIFYDILVSFDS